MSKYGEIDLENECVVTLYLDERVVYQGKVTGEGIPDVRNEPLDLGRYGPGQSRVLRAEIVWNASGKAKLFSSGYSRRSAMHQDPMTEIPAALILIQVRLSPLYLPV